MKLMMAIYQAIAESQINADRAELAAKAGCAVARQWLGGRYKLFAGAVTNRAGQPLKEDHIWFGAQHSEAGDSQIQGDIEIVDLSAFWAKEVGLLGRGGESPSFFWGFSDELTLVRFLPGEEETARARSTPEEPSINWIVARALERLEGRRMQLTNR